MITGARQVGKTYCSRKFAKENFPYVVEINFLENPSAVTLFENASDNRDILLRISALTDVPMEKGKTLIFFDEVQECKEMVTAIKFLVEEGSFRYILNNIMQNKAYEIKQAIVLCNENIEVRDRIFYCPVYLAGLLKKRTVPKDYIYNLDLSILQ